MTGERPIGGQQTVIHWLLATAVYVVALRYHLDVAGHVDLPADGVASLRRSVDVAQLEAFPGRGNSIGRFYWFGVADDYVLAPFLLGVTSLPDVLSRCALFHASVAVLGYGVGAAAGSAVLGLVWGLCLATVPDLVGLTGDYPANYRTTHWALGALVSAAWMARPDAPNGSRAWASCILAVSAALAVASHPFGLAALPAAALTCLLFGTRPSRRQLCITAVLVLSILGPYLATNLPGLSETLFGRGSDTRGALGEVLRATMTGFAGFWDQARDLPGRSATASLLFLGLPLAFLLRRSRPAALFTLLWVVGAPLGHLLAGYEPKPWHLRPVLHLVLGLGVAGWAAAASLLPGFSGRRRLRRAGAIVGCVALLLWVARGPSASQTEAATPAQGFGGLATAVLELADNKPFQYFEAQARCPLTWAAEATLLDMRLRSGEPTAGTDSGGPLIAAIEELPGLADKTLVGREQSVRLSNGITMGLYRSDHPEAWLDLFFSYCRPQWESDTSTDIPVFVGGPPTPAGASPCWLKGPCPGDRAGLAP